MILAVRGAGKHWNADVRFAGTTFQHDDGPIIPDFVARHSLPRKPHHSPLVGEIERKHSTSWEVSRKDQKFRDLGQTPFWFTQHEHHLVASTRNKAGRTEPVSALLTDPAMKTVVANAYDVDDDGEIVAVTPNAAWAMRRLCSDINRWDLIPSEDGTHKDLWPTSALSDIGQRREFRRQRAVVSTDYKIDGKCDRTPVAAPTPAPITQPSLVIPSVEQRTEQRTPADTSHRGRTTSGGWRTYVCDPNCKHENTRPHREAGVLICLDCEGCVGPLVDPRWRMAPILEKSRNPDMQGAS
jgi:hypothetical protein